MPKIISLVQRPQSRATTGRLHRSPVTQEYDPDYFSRRVAPAIHTAPSTPMVPPPSVGYTPPPSLPAYASEGTPVSDMEISPEGRIANQIADETAPIGLGSMAKGKALGALAKGIAGGLAGASISDIAGAIAGGQVSPAAAASLVNHMTMPAIGRQGIATAVRGVEDAFGLKGWDAVNAARQDPVSRDITIGPEGLSIGPGLPETQQQKANDLDQAEVRNRDLNTTLTGMAYQAGKDLVPNRPAGWAGIAQTPALSDVYGAAAADFDFSSVPESELGPEGVTIGNPNAPISGSMTLQQFAAPEKYKATLQQKDIIDRLLGRVSGGGKASQPSETERIGNQYADYAMDLRGELNPNFADSLAANRARDASIAAGLSSGDAKDISAATRAAGGIEAANAAAARNTTRNAVNTTQDTSVSDADSRVTGGGSGTFLCTELHRQGLMPDEVYRADSEYGKTVNPIIHAGYAVWAEPLAKKMQTSKLLTAMAKPFVLGWARNMARRMGVKAKFSVLGAVVENIGVPACFMLGYLKSKEKAAWV